MKGRARVLQNDSHLVGGRVEGRHLDALALVAAQLGVLDGVDGVS